MAEACRFVLRRLNWRPAGDCFIRLPGEARLAAFGTSDAADAARAGHEAEVRGRTNPFRCGSTWHALTALPEPVFRDWVADAGLLPPAGGDLAAWRAWWAGGHAGWTDEQRRRVWDGLARVRFFEVLDRPAASVAFAVVRVMWEYNDSWYEPGAEGGRPVKAFRTRERAEAERARLEAEARRDWDAGVRLEAGRWELENWPARGEEVGTEGREAFDRLGVPLYEVVELDLGEEQP